jgi:hypothetical protein
MWEEILDALERRVPRKEASDEDVREVKKEWQKAPEETQET